MLATGNVVIVAFNWRLTVMMLPLAFFESFHYFLEGALELLQCGLYIFAIKVQIDIELPGMGPMKLSLGVSSHRVCRAFFLVEVLEGAFAA